MAEPAGGSGSMAVTTKAVGMDVNTGAGESSAKSKAADQADEDDDDEEVGPKLVVEDSHAPARKHDSKA